MGELNEIVKRCGLQSTLEQLIECLYDKEHYIVEVRHGLQDVLEKYKGRYDPIEEKFGELIELLKPQYSFIVRDLTTLSRLYSSYKYLTFEKLLEMSKNSPPPPEWYKDA